MDSYIAVSYKEAVQYNVKMKTLSGGVTSLRLLYISAETVGRILRKCISEKIQNLC
jgi:hypothetical protein